MRTIRSNKTPAPGVSLAFVLGLAVPAAAQTCWQLQHAPPPRYDAAVATDLVQREAVLFGGWNGGDVFEDTWLFDGTNWRRAAELARPPARFAHAMAYSPRARATYLFGGIAADRNTRLGDLWKWTGSNWEPVEAAAGSASPTPRSSHAMIYDLARDELVLFGGETARNQRVAETWTFSIATATWTQEAPSGSPSARVSAGFVYDVTRGRGVLFGGFATGAGPQNDTWDWDGSNWTQRNIPPANAPPPRYSHGMVYAQNAARIVVFGGFAPSALGNDTWQLQGNTWSSVGAASPAIPARHAAAMFFDPTGPGRVVVHGGEGRGAANDTWELTPADWAPLPTDPAARSAHQLATDPAGTGLVLHGGFDGAERADTWRLANGAWTPLSPALPGPAVYAAGFASDGTDLILTCGWSRGRQGWTWRFDGTNWNRVNGLATEPAPRIYPAVCTDLGGGGLLLFGGELQRGPTDDTWRWNGSTWQQLLPATRPPARTNAAMVRDPQRGRIVLFGGRDSGNQPLSDIWEWDGSDWQQILPATNPAARFEHAMAYDPTRQRVILSGGELAGRLVANDVWEWDGTAWEEQTVLPILPDRRFHALAHDPGTGNTYLVAGESPSTGRRAETFAMPPRQMGPVRILGRGCGGLSLTAEEAVIGGSASITGSGHTPFVPAALFYGLDAQQFGGLPLPIDLASFGAPGCSIRIGLIAAIVQFADGRGDAAYSFDIPRSSQLVGASLFYQNAESRPGANALRLVLGNGVESVIGKR